MKKILSVMLAILMIATTVPYVSLGADEEAETAIVFFKVGNDLYGDFVVYAYSFNEDQTTSDLGSWPGKAMDAVEGEDGYYSCVIPADTYGLVFSREGVPAVQTPDIIYSAEYNGKCYDYESNEWIAVDFSGDKVKGMPLTIDVGTDTIINIGQGEKYYDEDGYIITGDDSDCMVTINESCNITLRDVTTGQLRFGYAPADSVFNITLEGENEITDRVMVYKNYMTFDGDEDAYFVAPFLNDSGNGTEITINGGNIELSSEYTPLNCRALTINGGTVTAESNAEQSVCVDQLILNGGQLNVVNTSVSFDAIAGNVIMNKDALLKISNSGKEIFDDNYEFTKAEDLGEDYCLFVRYDTEGGFAPAKDILDTLKGQSYVEIKVDFHEHAFEVGGYCDCGEACAHGSYTDSVCDVCGTACAHGSYTDSVCDVCAKECHHESYSDGMCDECGLVCTHDSYTDSICDVCGSECTHKSYTSAEDGNCPDCGVLITGRPLIIDVSKSDNKYYYVGGDSLESIYDEDGIIFTGYNENVGIDILEGCNLTFDNLTVDNVDDAAADDTVYITLKGVNEMKRYFGFYKADFIVDGDEDAVLKFDNMSTDGNDGTFTLNGGNLILDMETDVNIPTLNNEALVINGGSVTASNNYSYTLSCPVELNSGTLNIISTASDSAAIDDKVVMKKGTLLTVSTESTMLSDWYGTDIAISETENENSLLFVRYDKESAFVPVSDIKAALEGKHYAEIKVDSHTHLYENGKCVCGFECVHKEATDKGFEATCKKTGLTDGSHCTVCSMILTAQKEIPVVSHKDTNGDYKCDFGCGYEFPKPVTPTEPSTEPTIKPSEPSTEPTTKPGAEDTTKPSTEPTTKPNVEDTTKPAETTKPTETTKPAEPTTTPSTEEPTTQHTHTEVVIPAVKATYTADGLTAGKKCSECGEILVKQKKVARKKLKKVTSLKKKAVKLASGSKTTLTLSWKKVTGAEKYVVQQYVNKKWKTVATTKKNSYTVKKLKANKSYKFRVRAKAGKYYGSYSKTYTAKTVPLKPTLTVKAGKKQLTASWKTVANITGYEVQYSTSKKFTKKTTKKVTIKKAKTKKTTIKKLTKGKKYYVKVRAYKTVGKKKIYGAWSTVKTVKVK